MKLILLDPDDNVATAADDLRAGTTANVSERFVCLTTDVPRGHKVALREIACGADVIRYGEVIGMATADIGVGAHVHVHNLVSKRLPGDVR